MSNIEEALRRIEAAKTGRRCVGCGCTDSSPCLGGCHWVRADLCSACEELYYDELDDDAGDLDRMHEEDEADGLGQA